MFDLTTCFCIITKVLCYSYFFKNWSAVIYFSRLFTIEVSNVMFGCGKQIKKRSITEYLQICSEILNNHFMHCLHNKDKQIQVTIKIVTHEPNYYWTYIFIKIYFIVFMYLFYIWNVFHVLSYILYY